MRPRSSLPLAALTAALLVACQGLFPSQPCDRDLGRQQQVWSGFSADGELLFTSLPNTVDDGDWDLAIIESRTGRIIYRKRNRDVSPPGDINGIAWDSSRPNTIIGFSIVNWDNKHAFEMNGDGTAVRALEACTFCIKDMSQSGTQAALVLTQDTANSLKMIALRAGSTSPITTYPETDGTTWFRLSPDGKLSATSTYSNSRRISQEVFTFATRNSRWVGGNTFNGWASNDELYVTDSATGEVFRENVVTRARVRVGRIPWTIEDASFYGILVDPTSRYAFVHVNNHYKLVDWSCIAGK